MDTNVKYIIVGCLWACWLIWPFVLGNFREAMTSDWLDWAVYVGCWVLAPFMVLGLAVGAVAAAAFELVQDGYNLADRVIGHLTGGPPKPRDAAAEDDNPYRSPREV